MSAATGLESLEGRGRAVEADRRPAPWSAADVAALALVLVVAAVLRFVDLQTRGTWDADQGHEMLMLQGLVRDGVWPLLGDATSIGGVHQGALYYYLLAPFAALGGSDPLVVVGAIALLASIAAGLVWWTARRVGGSAAGLAAGLLAATSATAIHRSVFIWNPNVLAFSVMVAVAAAFRAWETRHAGWWLVAAIGLSITMQSHLLGAVLAPPFIGLFVADVLRSAPAARRRLGLAGVASLVAIAAGYLPLLAYELGHDFAETRAAIAFLTGGGQGVAIDPATRLVFVGMRVLAWPLAGLITDAPVAGTLAALFVVGTLVWRLRAAAGLERTFVRWTAATFAWCWIVLGLGVGGLATVTPLPVDHYHAFLDPLVFVVAGLGIGALWRLGVGGVAHRAGPVADRAASFVPRVAAVAISAALLLYQVGTWPPATAPDGGWPAAQAAASRIEASAAPGAIALVSLPSFKTPEAYEFPLAHAGRTISAPEGAETLVVVCDALFVTGCGGAAEATAVSGMDGGWATSATAPVDMFEAAPGRTLSVYRR